MIQYEEQRLRLLDNEGALKEIAGALGLDMLRKEQERLEAQSAENGFWDDVENSQKVLRKIAQLKNKIAAYDNLKADFDDTLVLIELADEEEDLSMSERLEVTPEEIDYSLDYFNINDEYGVEEE